MPVCWLWGQSKFLARSHERRCKREPSSLGQNSINSLICYMNVVCFSHTLDNVGNHLVIPTLVEFGSLWIRMFRHSCKAKLLWKGVTGQTPRSYSETRWWSKWGVSSVWRCRKVRRRGKGPKSLPTATATTSSNTFWLTVTNELEAWACRHYWCWRTFCESHVFFGRGWSFGCCLLWEIKRCFLILSSSLFP